jgi:hypothetical protein
MSNIAQAYRDQDTMRTVYVHSRGQDNSATRAETAGKLAEAAGLYRQTHLTYGGGQYQSSADYTQLNSLAHAPHANVNIERHALSSAHNDNLEMEKLNFQLSLINAAGSMTDELHDVIAELTERVSDLTTDQKAKFTVVIFNTYQLQQANEGRIELTQSQMQELGEQTLDMMTELALDRILPSDLKIKAVEIIRETAVKFDIPALDTRLELFEKETSVESVLAHSISALKETLQAMLDADELDEDTRLEVEELLEKLDAHEDGEPLPRDIIKALEGLSEKIQDMAVKGELSQAMTELSERLQSDTENVVQANIELRAEISGLTVTQIKAIDAYLDRLEEIAEALPDSEIELKDMIAEAIALIDKDPVSIEATAALDQTLKALDDPKITSLLKDAILSSDLSMIRDEGQFIQKTMVDRMASRDQVAPQMVREQTQTYASLKTLRAAVLQTLTPANISVKSSQPKSFNSKPKPQEQSSQPKATPKQKTSKSRDDFSAKPDQRTPNSKPSKDKKTPTQDDPSPRSSNAEKPKKKTNEGNASEKEPQKPSSPTNESDAPEQKPNHPESHPVIVALDKALEAVAAGPSRMATAVVEVVNVLGGRALETMAQTNVTIKNALNETKANFNNFVEKAVETIANKAGKPVEFVREQFANMVDAVKDKFEALKPKQNVPEPEYNDFSADTKKQTQDIFSDGIAAENLNPRTIKSVLSDGCASCVSAFCDACAKGGGLLKKLNPFQKNAVSGIFAKAAGVFSRIDNDFNAAPKRPSVK